MDLLTFVAASIALLITPGPTNTLLATSGASIGVRRSLSLLGAEICGYLAAITILQVMVGPLIAAMPVVGITLRITFAVYLVYLAIKLWQYGTAEFEASGPITFNRVLLTTFLNPKGLIFALTVLPQESHLPALLPWIAALALMIGAIGYVWIVVGASLRTRFDGVISSSVGYRLSAIALTLLAGFVTARGLN
jgi:threonine/homoserine/homoserine lactone efflux protein